MVNRLNIIKGVAKEQQYLLPVNVMEWLPENDVVYVILAILEMLDLSSFIAKYRSDGVGSAFYDPRCMLGIVIYAMIRGEHSSRKIEISCRYDIAYRIVAQGLIPDHTTIFRFKQQNTQEIKGLFKQLAQIIVESGITRVGVIAIDGTKMGANAALSANRKAKHIEAELNRIFTESLKIDEQETTDGATPDISQYNLPKDLATLEKRKKVLLEAQAKLKERQDIAAKKQKERIDEREKEEEETGKKKRGRKLSEPLTSPAPDAKVNPTDPTSQVMSTPKGFIQGFNAQIVVTEDQFILSASVTNDQNDKNQLKPMMNEIDEFFSTVRTPERPYAVIGDAGYYSAENMKSETIGGVQLFLATSKERKFGDIDADSGFFTRLDKICRPSPNDCGPTIPELASIATTVWQLFFDRDIPATQTEICKRIMDARVRSPTGRELYRKRKVIVEPVFGNIKHNMRFLRFSLKGMDKCDGEFSLAAISHNIVKINCNKLLGKLISSFRISPPVRQNTDIFFQSVSSGGCLTRFLIPLFYFDCIRTNRLSFA